MSKLILAIFIFFIKVFPQEADNVIGKARGDLDNDGIPEFVKVVRFAPDSNLIIESELQIFKQIKGKYVLWYKTRNPIESYKENEAGGTGFISISIKRVNIVITHSYGAPNGFSGSEIIQKYRLINNEWYLIGITNKLYSGCPPFDDSPFISKITLDFNLLTGNGNIDSSYEQCPDNIGKSYLNKKGALPKKSNLKFSNTDHMKIKMDEHKVFSKEFIPFPNYDRSFLY